MGFGRKAAPYCHAHRQRMRPQRLRSGLWQMTRDEQGRWRQLVCPVETCHRYHIEVER